MGQNAQTGQATRGVVTIDWMVLAVAAIALLFLVGTMIRTSVEGDPSINGGLLRGLSDRDRLLVFQNFSFEAENWNPSATSDDLPGLGPVLGPFGTDPVQRSFIMPTTADAAVIQFEVHLLGPWSVGDSLRISLGETMAAVINVDDTIMVTASSLDGLTVRSSQNIVTPRVSEASLGGGGESFTTVRLQMIWNSPPETIALRLQATAEGDAQWTLDNLSVAALAGDSRN